MTINDERDLEAMKRIGKIVGATLREMRQAVRPGMTTLELDTMGAAILQRHGARSAPPLVYGFPGQFCISVNAEAAHGIPGGRVLRAGDLVKIDLTAELDGYMADAAVTAPVGPLSSATANLAACARMALTKAIGAVRAGARLNEIGQAAEQEVLRHGYTVIAGLCGHGVGHTIHEEPREILNYYNPRIRTRMTEGQVLAIEPHITTGDGRIARAADGWTLATVDGATVANFEHSVVVTRGRPIVLTAA